MTRKPNQNWSAVRGRFRGRDTRCRWRDRTVFTMRPLSSSPSARLAANNRDGGIDDRCDLRSLASETAAQSQRSSLRMEPKMTSIIPPTVWRSRGSIGSRIVDGQRAGGCSRLGVALLDRSTQHCVYALHEARQRRRQSVEHIRDCCYG